MYKEWYIAYSLDWVEELFRKQKNI